MPDLVVGLLLGDPGPHWQDRRGPVQGLDLRFLVHAEDDGLIGREGIRVRRLVLDEYGQVLAQDRDDRMRDPDGAPPGFDLGGPSKSGPLTRAARRRPGAERPQPRRRRDTSSNAP